MGSIARKLKSKEICCTKQNKEVRLTLLIGAYHAIAMKLHELGYLPKERLDMALTLLRDPSVIMLSKGDDGKCYAAYDCQSEDDFNDLRFCEIE